jgi:hypothetical protein
MGIEKGWDNQQLSSEFTLKEDLIKHVRELVDRSKHLRQFPLPPIL